MGSDVCREPCCGGPLRCKNREKECLLADPETYSELCPDCMYDSVAFRTRLAVNSAVCALCDTLEHYRDGVSIRQLLG